MDAPPPLSQGWVTASELRCVAAHLCPSAALDWGALGGSCPVLLRQDAEQVGVG